MWAGLSRLFGSLAVLFLVSVVLFTLVHAIPISPARVVLGTDATDDDIAAFDHDHGLDRPLLAQYGAWIGGIFLRGDFGISVIDDTPIGPRIARTFPITLELVVLGFILALVLAIPLGVVSALWSDGVIDHFSRLFAVIGVSVPGFCFGLLLIDAFAVHFQWFPPGGFVPWRDGAWPHLRSLALPTVALGFYYVGIISRMTRSSVADVLRADHVRTARAMGLGRTRILVYVLKNALSPVVTVAAMSFGYMFGWALIVEQVFNIAGMSRALLTAIFQRDYLMVENIVLVITAIFLAANLFADFLYRALNPRISG
jgi:peptide/nickel transport system permease protein